MLRVLHPPAAEAFPLCAFPFSPPFRFEEAAAASWARRVGGEEENVDAQEEDFGGEKARR